jgi:hypothetical protein
MKTCRLWFLFVVVAAVLILFGNQAYAASPREDVVRAYLLIKMSNNNYSGHRDKALRELEVVGRELGLDMRSRGQNKQPQVKSDVQMSQAFQILRVARDKLDRRDREHEAGHLERALREVDLALRKR